MVAGRVLGVHRGRVVVAAVAGAILIAALGGTPSASAATPSANCQPFGNKPCLLPFPDNRFSKADPTSATGLRVQMPIHAMPTNTAGALGGISAPMIQNNGRKIPSMNITQ